MPSLRTRIIYWVIWILYWRNKHRDEAGWEEYIRTTWKQYDAPEETPSFILSDPNLNVEKETYETHRRDGETWDVVHCRPNDDDKEGDSVIVYWHGGGFIHQVSLPMDIWGYESS